MAAPTTDLFDSPHPSPWRARLLSLVLAATALLVAVPATRQLVFAQATASLRPAAPSLANVAADLGVKDLAGGPDDANARARRNEARQRVAARFASDYGIQLAAAMGEPEYHKRVARLQTLAARFAARPSLTRPCSARCARAK
jgi:negative regulator of sigma E activity